MNLRKPLLFCLLLLTTNAFSYYTCHGLVNGVTIEPKTGALLVENIGSLTWPRLCSVNNEINGVSPDACNIIYETLLNAQLTRKSVTFWFNDFGDCSQASHPSWQELTGWYFGPKLNEGFE